MLSLGQKIYICVYRSFEFFLMANMTGISMLHAVKSNYFHLVDAMCNYWDNDLHLSYIKKLVTKYMYHYMYIVFY